MMQKIHISRMKVIILTVAVMLSLCAISGGMVAAKYYKDMGGADGLIGAKNFYFTSNLLDGKEHTLAPGSNSITFTLGNHADDLRFSDVDITYTVTVEPAEEIAISPAEGTLLNDKVNDAKVTVSGLKKGVEYTFKAVGSGGYTKTLTATIRVPEEEPRIYYHIDEFEGEYILLTVWNEGDAAGDVNITYSGIPDNSNPNMGDWLTGDQPITKWVPIPPHASLVFRFFSGTVETDATAKELY